MGVFAQVGINMSVEIDGKNIITSDIAESLNKVANHLKEEIAKINDIKEK